jgi:membrane peptidoglycan carboxypeptidase
VQTTQAISEDIAADTSYALQQVTKYGTGTNANTIGRPVAGKTGTATTDAGHVRSSWFVGYTPQLVTAVMYSRGNGNEPLDGYLDTFYGGEHPALTWAAVMRRALEGEDILEFPPAANLEQTVAGHSPTPTPTYTPSPTQSSTPKPSRTPQPSNTPSPTQAPPSPSDTGGPSVPSPSDSGSPSASQQPQGDTGAGTGNGQPAGQPAGRRSRVPARE